MISNSFFPYLELRCVNIYDMSSVCTTLCRRGGSKNRNPRNPPKFTKSSVFYRPIVSANCLNLQLQPPILPGRRTWTVDEIEVASSLNFSIVKC